MATRTLVVSCPDWPITAAGVPADVAAAMVFANRVEAVSVAARAEGVRVGLRRREAQSRCPGLVVIERDPGQEARAFEPVVTAVEAFGPKVEVSRPGTCAIPTRGPARYFGGEESLVEQIGESVAGAVAGLLPAASTASAAHRGRASPVREAGSRTQPYWGIGVADGRFAATLAAGLSAIVAPGQSAAFLADFPVAVLGRPELGDLLMRLGIRTLGQLATLPKADVLARFGPDGAMAQRLARGLDGRPLAGRDPPPDLVVSIELDPPVDRVDTAAFAARTLAQELHERLVRTGMAYYRVRIEAETEHGEHLSRLWCHDGPFSPADVAERVRWQLDGWLSGASVARPTAGLTLLRLLPDEVVPDQGRQLGFWGGEAGIDERTARALARVQGLLGPEAVVTAVLVGGRGPEEQVRLVPWGTAGPGGRPERTTGPGGRSERKAGLVDRPDLTAPPWPGKVPPPAPAIVHGRSLVAEVVDGDGRSIEVTGRGLESAVPARLSVAGGPWMEVAAWAGPWPADERWWDPAAHRRRARLQVVLADGSAHLLALEAGCWGVEATYD